MEKSVDYKGCCRASVRTGLFNGHSPSADEPTYRLKTWTRQEGTIRLSMDDGPASREFLDDDYDEDNADIADDEPLALRAQELRPKPVTRTGGSLPRSTSSEASTLFEVDEYGTPPPPPPKI